MIWVGRLATNNPEFPLTNDNNMIKCVCKWQPELTGFIFQELFDWGCSNLSETRKSQHFSLAYIPPSEKCNLLAYMWVTYTRLLGSNCHDTDKTLFMGDEKFLGQFTLQTKYRNPYEINSTCYIITLYNGLPSTVLQNSWKRLLTNCGRYWETVISGGQTVSEVNGVIFSLQRWKEGLQFGLLNIYSPWEKKI